ncbi:MAG: hypothetical protein ACAH83_16720 [Alphaproteobacteria bacterium]
MSSRDTLVVAFMLFAGLAGGAIDRFVLAPADKKLELSVQQRGAQRKIDDARMFRENGFDVVGLMRMDSLVGVSQDCYTLKKDPDRGLTYKGCITHKGFGYPPEISELTAVEKIAPPGGP